MRQSTILGKKSETNYYTIQVAEKSLTFGIKL